MTRDPHVHDASENDTADGELNDIDAVILFPSLGVPCVIEAAEAQAGYVELLIATGHSHHLDVGDVAHYLAFQPMAELGPGARESGMQYLDADDILLVDEPWQVAAFTRGSHDDDSSAPAGAAPDEKTSYRGTQNRTVTFDKPIFSVKTCRLHPLVVAALKDDYPDVHRVLVRAARFTAGTMYEWAWRSLHPRRRFLDQLKRLAADTRGVHFPDDAYQALELRHPLLVSPEPVTRFMHLTDIHNSTAHNLVNLAPCRVLEDSADWVYSPPVGSLFNNYNANFTHLARKGATSGAQAYVLTGDIVDYGRGLHYPHSGGGADKTAWVEQMNAAGEGNPPDLPGIYSNTAQPPPSSLPKVTQIWQELGGNDQLQYVADANFKYFLEKKIVARYLEGKPVFTSLGNHDFHPHPFNPWPTSKAEEGTEPYTDLTPSDWNLTRYESLLAYGPGAYEAYVGSVIGFSMLGAEGGGGGLVSTPNCAAIYFFFVNPFLDYSVRMGGRSIMLVDFGRVEVRPQTGMMRSRFFFWIGLLGMILGIVCLVCAGIILGNSPGTWGTVAAGALIALGVILLIVGLLAMMAGARAGAFSGDFEALEHLPAAQEALDDEQLRLIDNWTAMQGPSGDLDRVLLCHALFLGRDPERISVKQLHDNPAAGAISHMKFGVIANGASQIVEKVQSDKILATLSGHSHFSAIYRLRPDGSGVTGEWPPNAEAGEPDEEPYTVGQTIDGDQTPGTGKRMFVITRASGPMAENNWKQADALEEDHSEPMKRQRRALPGGSYFEINPRSVTAKRVITDGGFRRARRAAFDSWKLRFNDCSTGNVDNLAEQVTFTFKYLSDLFRRGHDDPFLTPRWEMELSAIAFFAGGQKISCPLRAGGGYVPAGGGLPIDLATHKATWNAHVYAFDVASADFNRLRAVADGNARLHCALEYPGSEDPWIFQVKVKSVPNGAMVAYRVELVEFPDFDALRTFYQRRESRPSGS